MASLANIRPSILNLPPDEVLQMHLQVRESRRILKKPLTKASAKRRSDRKGLLDLLDEMTPSEMDEIMERFGGDTS